MLMGSWAALILVNVGFVISAARYVQTGASSAAYTNVVMLWLYDFVFFFVCGVSRAFLATSILLRRLARREDLPPSRAPTRLTSLSIRSRCSSVIKLNVSATLYELKE